MSLQRPVRKRDPEYLTWIRSRPCVVSGEYSQEWRGYVVEAHHVRKSGHGGTGTKPDDSRAVPLRRIYHMEYHDIGKEAFELKYGIELEVVIDSLNHIYTALALTRKPKATREPKERITVQVEHCKTCGGNHKYGWPKVKGLMEVPCIGR